MPRPRQRVNLSDGLKLNLNYLVRRHLVQPGYRAGPHVIQWSNSYTGDVLAQATITSSTENPDEGWLRLQFGSVDQWLILVSRPRHFGGRQWYFVCPVMNRRASVLWKPPGASEFCSRQTWRRQVAYATQFLTRDDRAHRGQAKIRSRLCSIGGFDPDDWDLPPKPKWMRWRTYTRAADKFERYEAMLDEGTFALLARLKGII